MLGGLHSIPSEQIALLHEFLKDTLKTKYRIDCLESREADQLEIIAKWNAKRLGNNRKLKVHRHVQGLANTSLPITARSIGA